VEAGDTAVGAVSAPRPLNFSDQGITYTRHRKVLDVGPIHATTETRERIPLPPILGGIALVGGLSLVIVGARRKA
jgi:hypothetical protein